jgi:hypothetical protein
VLLIASGAALCAAADVVVIKGGARIELKKPPARQGNVVLLTRSDGTLLSVPAAEIDWKATAAAASAAPAAAKGAPAAWAAPMTPAEAARAGKDGPKARVKLTDADVGHVTEEDPAAGAKKDGVQHPASGHLEVIDYEQEKSGSNLIVRGSLRNATATPAANARLTVTAMDEKGEKIASGEAGLSNGLVESGASVSFSVTIPVGERTIGTIRFNPQWIVQPPPGPTPAPAGAAPPAAKPPAAKNPAPAPTPYGLGTLYAAPAPQASTTPPADGKSGYLPNVSSPENQPKPPQ